MTLFELSQLYFINQEIIRNENKLRRLRAQRGVHSQTIDDMPHGSGPRSSRDDELTAEILDLETIIRGQLVQLQRERKRLELYIISIPDSLTRQVFECRFVELMSWREVAEDIGAGYTAESCKKICYRYLEREQGGLTARQAAEAQIRAEGYESQGGT